MITDERTTTYGPATPPLDEHQHQLHVHYASNAIACGHTASCALVTRPRNWPTISHRPKCDCGKAA